LWGAQDSNRMRLENGMTQEQLAEKIENKKKHQFKSGKSFRRYPRLSTLQKVASVFRKQLKVAML
jgi:DNA-binding XRE family transcriptional regulator